ncbi:MAG: flagellar export chaperone FliS [Kangiellaceae bacterium]|nr:flagellar export chaperone FliS [Kangiellaceae bacterium]MCW8999534.1 flagellar export chaperone FliS [Kangiellaceae bacterium]MCW9018439.1 flagellar export chaperone FliS [Kangiellaceae bacterium]
MGLTGASAYAKTGTTTGVENADPHRLIQMLIDGAIEKINRAKFFMQNNKIAEKGQHVSWAISIIGGLRSSLNLEEGGEVAQNLDSLYEYCTFTLVEANTENSEEKLESVLGVMREIKEGWDAIREQTLQSQSAG